MRSNKKLVLMVCSFIFGVMGMMTAAIGPALPELAGKTQVSLVSIGSVFSAIFLGALVAQLLTGPLGDRLGQSRVVLGGLVLTAAGILGFSLSRSLPVTLLFAFLTGLGDGGIVLGGNVLIGVIFNGRSVSALNLLNLFYGLGAFTGPTLVSFTLSQWNTGLPVLWLCALLLLVASFFMFGLQERNGIEKTTDSETGTDQMKTSVYRSGLLWGFGLIILIYVGIENGMGGWTTTYLQRATGMAIESAALVTAGFWLALTAGRMVSALIGIRLPSQTILLASFGGSVMGGLLLALTPGQQVVTIAAVLLIGFSFGSVYPTTVAITTGYFQAEPGRAVSVIAAMGSIGGALLPWLQGVVLENAGNAANAWFTTLGAMGMLLIWLTTRIRTRHRLQLEFQND